MYTVIVYGCFILITLYILITSCCIKLWFIERKAFIYKQKTIDI